MTRQPRWRGHAHKFTRPCTQVYAADDAKRKRVLLPCVGAKRRRDEWARFEYGGYVLHTKLEPHPKGTIWWKKIIDEPMACICEKVMVHFKITKKITSCCPRPAAYGTSKYGIIANTELSRNLSKISRFWVLAHYRKRRISNSVIFHCREIRVSSFHILHYREIRI